MALETPIDMKRAVGAPAATTDPGWAETTVRWLRGRRSGLVPEASKRPATALLLTALVKLKFRRHEMETFSDAAWTKHLEGVVENWTKRLHTDFAEFVERGGHPVLVEKARVEKAAREESLVVTDPITGETERIALDFDAFEEEIAKEHVPRSQLSPAHELDEIVADAAMRIDPRLGAW